MDLEYAARRNVSNGLYLSESQSFLTKAVLKNEIICVFDLLEYWSLRISKNKTNKQKKQLGFSRGMFLPAIILFWHLFFLVTLVWLLVTWLQLSIQRFLTPCQPLHTVIGLLGTFPGKHQISIWENKINGRRASPSLCLGYIETMQFQCICVCVGGRIYREHVGGSNLHIAKQLKDGRMWEE